MSDDSLADNPFTALFPSVRHAEQYVASYKSQVKEVDDAVVVQASSSAADDAAEHACKKSTVKDVLAISNLIERVFKVTFDDDDVSSGRVSGCVFLSELKETLKDRDWMDLDVLGQVVFERLMLSSPQQFVLGGALQEGEDEVLHYLYNAYIRTKQEAARNKPVSGSWLNECESVILQNARMALQMPDIFGGVDSAAQLLQIYKTDCNSRNTEWMEKFWELLSLEIQANPDEGGDVAEVFNPVLKSVLMDMTKAKLGDPDVYVHADLLRLFTRTEPLAVALVAFTTPSDESNGVAFERSLFGRFLCLSSVPISATGPYDYFSSPSQTPRRELDIMEDNIHQPLAMISDRMHQVFYNILRLGGLAKEKLLCWLANCLHANRGRAKLMAHLSPLMFSNMYASDGFFLNLCAVLLRLAKPFSQPCSQKLLKIDPTYIHATAGDRQAARDKGVHMMELNKETCLVPTDEGEADPATADSYTFVCECFFMTHQAIQLGMHVAQEKFVKLNQELHRTQGMYQDLVAQGGQDSEPGLKVKEQMEKGMQMYLCMKAALTETTLLDLTYSFMVSTATYISHCATTQDNTKLQIVSFPLPQHGTQNLKYMPEFVAENIMNFMVFLKRFQDNMYEMDGEKLDHLFSFILVFMGSQERMHNPHMRAGMAEALEALMPPKKASSSMVAHFYRSQLLSGHPHASQLADTLFQVFVSIEMTGQGVQFEQKFNYRRPMYSILEMMWGADLHKTAITVSAMESLSRIEEADAPLFLRFINLLINDAIFLLDEAMDYMQQIRTKQAEQEAGDWAQLPAQQRQENEANLRQIGSLARFHNIMGRDTIHILELITQTIKDIFLHDVLVDRIAAMLNHFLLHLVGPKKKNLKVKDFDKFEFKPSELVSIICKIYLNLAESDQFCAAVARDGRSYSHTLFRQAEQVLQKIMQPPAVIMDFAELGVRVKSFAVSQQAEDEVMADAPDEFLDAIMGTLMTEPVLLPSGNNVEKSTIARHLLSDQTDPFNRQPLTMEQVKPNEELKARILSWMEHQKANSSTASDS